MRPAPADCPEFYRGYLARVPDGDVLAHLEQQGRATVERLRDLDEGAAGSAYAPGKWTVKDVLGHLIDVERVFSYRALCCARGEPTPQPGFDQDAYVASGGFGGRRLSALLSEYERVRAATLALYAGLAPEAWERRGVANGVPLTPRLLAWVTAGHELHHLAVLRERYGVGRGA